MGSSVTHAEVESGYILVLETSRVGEQANRKTPQRQCNKCGDDEDSRQKVTKREGSAEGLQQIQRPSVHASQQENRELLHFQQCFLSQCQYDSSWIVKAIPEAMLTVVLKAKSATRCWGCPHLRVTGKRRPSIKHKTKMHYHLGVSWVNNLGRKGSFQTERVSDLSLARTNSISPAACID